MNAVAHAWLDDAPAYFAPTPSGSVTVDKTIERYLRVGSPSAQRSPEDQKIDALEKLPTNWDGRGSVPPSARAIATSREWLQPLREAATVSGKNWTLPHISASDGGEITFEWWRGDRKITLYFSGGAPEFVRVWGPHIVDEMESGSILSSDAFRKLWHWLNAA